MSRKLLTAYYTCANPWLWQYYDVAGGPRRYANEGTFNNPADCWAPFEREFDDYFAVQYINSPDTDSNYEFIVYTLITQ